MTQPGFVAISASTDHPVADFLTQLNGVGVTDVDVVTHHGVQIASWGLAGSIGPRTPLSMTGFARTRTADLTPVGLQSIAQSSGSATSHVLPPFGVVVLDDGGVTMIGDTMGFRQLYFGSHGGRAGLSTSATLLARCLGTGFDRTAVAVQSLLGWQLGQRTLFAHVTKLPPGASVRLTGRGLRVSESVGYGEPGSVSMAVAVARAAELLRESLSGLTDDRPDLVLQLTGGQDSRLLLSAVEPERRAGLRVMTLGHRGDPDVQTASLIAARYGMQHEVHGMDGIEDLDPADAWARCRNAVERLDGMADPLAFAALAWAEQKFSTAPRLSGLGGEVARGFYYYGPDRGSAVTRRRAARLASWRMFANEAVEDVALKDWFRSWARPVAEADVFEHLRRSGRTWLSATDDLYLRHRMQRWAGVTDTAWCFEREIINPMLDDEFLDLAERLAPADKRNSRFLARLQMALDPELGRLPLEARPAPIAYTGRNLQNSTAILASTGRRLARKVEQRVRHSHRAPAGGQILAAKVVRFWRQHPDVLEPVRSLGILDDHWLDAVVSGRHTPDPSSVSFVSNILVSEEMLA